MKSLPDGIRGLVVFLEPPASSGSRSQCCIVQEQRAPDAACLPGVLVCSNHVLRNLVSNALRSSKDRTVKPANISSRLPEALT